MSAEAGSLGTGSKISYTGGNKQSATSSSSSQGLPAQSATNTITPTQPASKPKSNTSNNQSQASAAPAAPTPPAPTNGKYVDGSYTGNTRYAYYGYVQVKAVITNGNISSVVFLKHPNDNRTSQYINAQVMPILKQEAIQSQNAQVNTVSGASDTSGAFRQSLSDALAQAKA